MSPHTIRDIQEADDQYDRHTLEEVSAITGIPYGTLNQWNTWGWISTETNHHAGPDKYSWEDVQRADELWDRMPLGDVADVMGIPEGTLRTWSTKGWINTDIDWKARKARKGIQSKIQRAVTLVYDHDKKQCEVARILGVSDSTVSRYLRLYREQ